MVAKLSVGPPVITVNKNTTFMVTDQWGEIDPDQAQGVFSEDTRFLSSYRMRIDGQRWELLSSSAVSYDCAHFYLSQPPGPTIDYTSFPEGNLGLVLVRTVDEGIHEAFEITNYGIQPAHAILELELSSDFADIFEVRGARVPRREHLLTEWHPKRAELVTTYRNGSFMRGFRYLLDGCDPQPSYANGWLRFSLHLPPDGVWKACGHMVLQHGRDSRAPRCMPVDVDMPPELEEERAQFLQRRWLSRCTELETPTEDLRIAYRQAVDDMGALRLFERDLGQDAWVPAAGVPWFVTLFGRDSLIASLQCLPVQARFAEGALRTLAGLQASQRDDRLDAQPGKILHEIRRGELAYFGRIVQAPYYGTWDATSLFLMALHQAWLWLGDDKLVRDLLPNAERALEWIDRFGDLDGDGFQEYRTFSPHGYENMGWKDAHHAVVYADGSPVPQPKATCELQGYVYAAKLGMAELFDAFGRPDRARQLESEAAELKRHFNEAFWMEAEGCYAFGLDGDKRQITSIASNVGHCLWTGIVAEDKAQRVVRRMLAPDMWSGWGIRTLSSGNPAYNPFSYQRGSVWPHDNAIIAAGMKRYGYAAETNQVARGIIDATSHFQSYRLPEVFAGYQRRRSAFPVQYPRANIPQAWAAGSIFHLVQAILGLQADLPRRRLWVNPTLPAWLPSLRLTGLQVGKTRLDLRFWRHGDTTRFTVEDQRGNDIEVKRRPDSAASRREKLRAAS